MRQRLEELNEEIMRPGASTEQRNKIESEIRAVTQSVGALSPCARVGAAGRGGALDEEKAKTSLMPESANPDNKLKGTLLVAATLVAAIRLRGESIDNTPKVIATIHDSIKLARLVLRTLNTG